MSDVIGRAVVTISPDFTGFRPRVSAEMEKVAAEAGKRFNKTFASSLKGLKPALQEVVDQVKAVDTAVSKIDASELKELSSSARLAGSAISGTVDEAALLDSALNAIDPSDLDAVARAAGTATGSLEGTSTAAAATDAALAGIDTKDLAEVATAGVAARRSLDGATTSAIATDAALGAIDPTDLFEVSGAAQAATSALAGTTAGAAATDSALALIDSGDLVGVSGAAGAATAALGGTATAAIATDGALATIDGNDLTGVAVAAGAATASLTGTATAAGATSAQMSTLKTFAGGGVIALGALAAAGVKIAGDLEQAQIAFTGLLGSKAEADAFLATLKDFASTTPFEFEQVLPATQKLIALGQTGEEAISTLTTIGNAAAAVGASGASIDGVVTAIAQIQAKGKLSAQELNQIAERLPNFNRGDFLDKLAESIGVSTEEVRKLAETGDITSEQAIPQLLSALDAVPGAMGAMERQSVSLKGRLSTLADNVKFGLADAFTDLGNQISPTLEPLGASLNTALKQVGGAVAEIASKVLPLIVPLIDQLGPALSGALRGLSAVLGPVLAGFGVMLKVIGPIVSAIAPFVAALGGLIGVIYLTNKALGAFIQVSTLVNKILPMMTSVASRFTVVMSKMGTAVSSALTMIASHPFIAIAVVIAGLFFLMWKNSEKLRTAVGNLGRVIMAILGPAIDFVRNTLGNLLNVEFVDFGSILEWLGDRLAVFVQFLAEGLLKTLAAVGDVFSTYVMPVLRAVGGLVGSAFDAISSAISGLMPVLTAIGGFFANVVRQAGNLWAVLTSGREVADGVGEVLDNVFGNTGRLIDPISNVVTQVGNLWEVFSDGDDIAQGVAEILDNIAGDTGILVAPIRTFTLSLIDLWRTLERFGGGALDLLAGIFTFDGDRIADGAQEIAGSIGDIFTSVIPTALDGLSTLIFGSLNEIIDAGIRGIVDLPVIGGIGTALLERLRLSLNVLGGVTDIIAGVFTFDVDRILDGLSSVGDAIVNYFTTLPGLIGDTLTDASGLIDILSVWLDDAFDGLVENLGDIPFVGPLVDAIGESLSVALGGLSGIFDIVGGILTWDGAKVTEGVGRLFGALWDEFTKAIPTLLSALTDLFSDILPNALSAAVTAIADIPVLGDVGGFILEAIRGGLQVLGGLGDIIGGLLTFDGDRLLSGLGGVAQGIATWITELPGTVLGLLGDALGFATMISGWISSGLGSLADLIRDIPILGDLGAFVLDTIAGGFDIVGGIGDIIGGIFTWDGAKILDGLGGIVTTVGDFLIGLPGAVLGYVGDLGALLGDIISGAAEWIADNAPKLFDALKNLPEIIGDLISSAFGGIGDLLGSLFGSIFGGGGEVDKAAKDGAKSGGGGKAPAEKDNPIVGFFKGLFEGAKNWIANDALPTVGGAIGDFVSRLPSILGDIFGGLVSIVATIVPGLLGVFGDWLGDLGGLLVDILVGAFNFVVDNGPGILAAIGRWLVGLPGTLLGFLGDLGSTLLGWMSGAWDWLAENGGPMLAKLGSWLTGLPGRILGFLGDLGGTLLEWLGGAFGWLVENGPALIGDFLGWVASIPIEMLGALANLGITLFEWVANGFYWVVTEGPGALVDFLGWVASIPGQVISGLGALGSQLWEWARSAFSWIVTNGTDILSTVVTWASGIPGSLISAMAGFGQQLWDWAKAGFEWIVTNGVDILTTVLGWAAGVPGQIISAMAAFGQMLWDWAKAGFNWVVTNGVDILSGVASWAAGVPGQIVGFLGDLGTRIFDWAKGAFNTVRDRGPEAISNVVDFFKSIPERLFNALKDGVGAVGGIATDIGGRIWNAIKSSLDGVFDDIRNREVSVGPLKFKPFSFLPNLMAEGGIVTKATQAIVGEAGPEVIIPLTDPQRAKELVVQSGLLNIIQETPTAVSAAPTPAVSLPVPTPPALAGGASAAASATLEVPAVNVPAGLSVSAPSATVDTAPVSAAATTAMTDVVASATGALAPLTDWFATFPATAAASLSTFGPTVWTAAQPSFAFFVDSALAELNRLVVFITAFTPLVIGILTPFGPSLWAAMAPGLTTLRTSIESLFNGLGAFVTTWQDNLKRGLEGLPTWAGGIGTQIVNALSAPFRTFASGTWNPFASAMNAALDQIPATAAITIPNLPTAHSGGIVGDRLPETGGPLSSSEMVVKMKRGEGVLPTDAMSKLAPYEFEALRAGNVDRLADRVYGERDPRKDETGDGVPYSPTPAERNFSLTPDTVIAALDGVIAGLRGNVAALVADPTYTAKFLGGVTDKAMTEGSKFVGAKVNEANAAALNSVGGVGTAFPTGVPAALGPAIEMMRAWKGRSGSSQAILRYFAATGVPGRATSIFRPGAVTRGSGGQRASLHSMNRAVDFAGPTPSRDSPELLRIYNAFAPVASILQERIYSGPGGGYVRNPITRADHHDHVHIGLAEGAVLRGAVDALIGEAGPEVRVRLSDVGALSGFLRGSAIAAPVIDTPTFTKLGVTPEVVLPLSRPDRARDLAKQALAATSAGQAALSNMGTSVMGDGAIFTPRSQPRQIRSVEEITPPERFVKMWAAMKSVEPDLDRLGVKLGTTDLVLGGSGNSPYIGGSDVRKHMLAWKALMDGGFDWKVYEDLSGRFTAAKVFDAKVPGFTAGGGVEVRFDNPNEARTPPNQPFWMADDPVKAMLERLGDAQRFFNLDLSKYVNEGGLPDFVGAFNSLPAFLQEAVMAAQVARPTPGLDVGATLSNIARFADGGIFTQPTFGQIGEAGDEVLIPLERPQRALALADQSGLLEVLEAARQQNAQTRTTEAPAAPGAQVPFDGGPLGGGPGNTYNITGISLDQVIAEIEARDEATNRKRR